MVDSKINMLPSPCSYCWNAYFKRDKRPSASRGIGLVFNLSAALNGRIPGLSGIRTRSTEERHLLRASTLLKSNGKTAPTTETNESSSYPISPHEEIYTRSSVELTRGDNVALSNIIGRNMTKSLIKQNDRDEKKYGMNASEQLVKNKREEIESYKKNQTEKTSEFGRKTNKTEEIKESNENQSMNDSHISKNKEDETENNPMDEKLTFPNILVILIPISILIIGVMSAVIQSHRKYRQLRQDDPHNIQLVDNSRTAEDEFEELDVTRF